MLVPDDVLNARYRLLERIATGGMGDVWRAVDLVLGRTVAVKVMLPALLTDPGFEARFRAEARMMAGLHHPGVVGVYDYGESPLPDGRSAAYLVMAYVDGQPLSRLIDSAGRLSVGETMSVVAQAAEALHAAHAGGIIHRDVKPANLLVQPDGTVVLVDFGVARSAAATTITGADSVMGTALYMAPEQASGGLVSPATDIYALGVVAYHCLAGRPPFTGERAVDIAVRHVHDDPPPLPDDVPGRARALVERAMAKEPAGRFPHALAFAAAARAAAAAPEAAVGATVRGGKSGEVLAAASAPVGPAMPADPAAPGVPWPGQRRRRAVAGAALAVLVGLGGLAGLLGLRSGDGAPAREGTAPSSAPAPTGKVQSQSPGGGATPARSTVPPASLPSAPAASAPGSPGGSPVPKPTGEPTGVPEPTASGIAVTPTPVVVGTIPAGSS